MGTWGMPKNKDERALLKKKIRELKDKHDEISDLVGDDIVLDHFELAVDRLKLFTKTKLKYPDHRTSAYLHPAFYDTPQGTLPGVCALCRTKVP